MFGVGALGAAVAAIAFYFLILRGLPEFETLAEYRPALVSMVLDRSGNLVGEFFEERRRLVALEDVPDVVVKAFIASEDDAFYEHRGIDYRSIARAAWIDLTAGEIKQGASTITQQTVKSLLLTPERRFERKIKEMILARRIERDFTKDEILTLYLNQIYLGSGAYGVSEAGRTYFGKELGELSLGEAALLAGLPAAPTRYSPRSAPKSAETRRQYVLGRMRRLGFIDEAAYREAAANPPELREPESRSDAEVAAWFTEEVRRYLYDVLGGEVVLRGGLQVETTLDLDLQRAAHDAVRGGLEALDRRQGWKGPLRKVAPEAFEDELQRLSEENRWFVNEEGQGPILAEREEPVVGLVLEIDAKEDRATVAIAPGVTAPVWLSDVAWARPRDPSVSSTPRKRIRDVFSVGDVALFRLIVDDKEEIVRLGLAQDPEVEGALLALDVSTGEARALIGGYDYGRSQFDRAIQARRQPGSAFTPLIYAAALEQGYTAVTTLYDRPVVYTDRESGFEWRPENYGRRFLGPLPMREALARSINNATIHLLDDLGVARVVRFAQRLGIRSELEPNLSLALGSSPVTVLELTRAYGVFANGGKLPPVPFITRVSDRDGNVLLENVVFPETEADTEQPFTFEDEIAVFPEDEVAAAEENADPEADAAGRESWRDDPYRVLSPATAFLAADLLRGVVDDPRGTGRRARALGRPLGGKTGTTNEQGDAWFVGFSRDLVVGVWVGFDERKVLGRGETGGRAALPVWLEFMRKAHRGAPARDFQVPDGITFARVDRSSGKLAAPDTKNAYFQAFRDGEEPTEHASDAPSSNETRRVLRFDF